ncbi:MAG: coproporphyrinogen III oxidase [Clostridiaceae bacterium]
MKITIRLNDMSYRYDVFQIFNIYFASQDIKFMDEGDYCIDILDSGILCSKGDDFRRSFNFDKRLTKKENIKSGIFLFLKEITGREYPWGTLTGIRPSKTALALLESNSEDEIVEYFRIHNFASEEKARLCIEVAKNEKRYVTKDDNLISVYVGMPFCPTKCLYCSFTSTPVGQNGELVEAYIKALFYEMDKIRTYIQDNGLKIQCVYFGGGTPTAVNDIQFEDVMERIYNDFIKGFAVEEFTVECGRPDSITAAKLQSMKSYGVDRISINPQTMNDETLKLLGRSHSSEDTKEKFLLAREMGFDNINMDIIVGLPHENESHLKNTCDKILELKPDNLTVHGLSVKRGSRLYEKILSSVSYKGPQQDELIRMFNQTRKLAESLGMKPYYMYRQKNMAGNMENIGYSVPGKWGIYNIQMIEEQQTIIACGADGITKVVFHEENRIERAPNLKDIREYISRIDETLNKKFNLLNTLYKRMEDKK